MKRAKKLTSLVLLGIGVGTISACGQPEPLRTVTDTFCLNDRRVSVEVEPIVGEEDLTGGNQYDTEQTVMEVLAHNEVHDALCKETSDD